jgi:hypothetical protein
MFKVERNENEIIIIPEKYAHKIITNEQNSKNSIIKWKANSKEEKLLTKKYGL